MKKLVIALALAASAALAQEVQEAQEMQETDAVVSYASQWLDSPESVSAWTNAHPVRVALIRKYGTASLSSCTFVETANAVAEYAANPEPFDLGDDLDSLKKDVLRSSLKIMKRALRQKGMSFVVAADGSNPVQTAINGLSEALNAAKMSGIKEWVDEWLPGSEWTAPTWMADEAVNSTIESVFFGDEDFERRMQFKLCAVLGVTEYNKFVDRYNGAEEPETPNQETPADPAEPAEPATENIAPAGEGS